MSNLEVVGSLFLYATLQRTLRNAEGVRQAVREAEAAGNVIVDIIPIYVGAGTAGVSAVFLKVAGSTKKRVDG